MVYTTNLRKWLITLNQ